MTACVMQTVFLVPLILRLFGPRVRTGREEKAANGLKTGQGELPQAVGQGARGDRNLSREATEQGGSKGDRAARQLHVSACLWGQFHRGRWFGSGLGCGSAKSLLEEAARKTAPLPFWAGGGGGGLWCPTLRAGVGPQRPSTGLAGWAELLELLGLGVLLFQGRSGGDGGGSPAEAQNRLHPVSSEGRSGRAPQPPRRR